jgi:hypothetical protein
VEQQLRTQEQLQKLAAMVNSASDAAAAQQHQQEQQQQPQPTQSGGTGATATAAALAVGGAAGPARMRQAPLLGLASTVSPPNSQRKLLAHLSASMRPADREVGGWVGGWVLRQTHVILLRGLLLPTVFSTVRSLVALAPIGFPGWLQMKLVALLTWQGLREWYCQLVTRLRWVGSTAVYGP